MITSLTAYDLIYKALRIAGIAALGDAVEGPVSDEAMMLLNTIRAEYSLNSRGLLKFDQTYTATGNKQFITLGTDINNAIIGDIPVRPSKIDQVIIINGTLGGTNASNNNFILPIYSYEEYRAKIVQNIFAVPQAAYIDNEYPVQNIYLLPGLTSGWSIRVMGTRYFTDYENVTDPYIDPPEYFQMLVFDLAKRLLMMYGQDVPQGLIIMSNDCSKHIKNHNFKLKMHRTKNDLMNPGSPFNFLAGI